MEIEDVIAKANGNIAGLKSVSVKQGQLCITKVLAEDLNMLISSARDVLKEEGDSALLLPKEITITVTDGVIQTFTTYYDAQCFSEQIRNILSNYVIPPMGFRG